MPPFHLCCHDATPAYERETRMMIRDLAPLVGRRISFGVVPDWHGEWPLAAHAEYCAFMRESSGELLLHGYFHERRRGAGPATWLTGGSDEMNGVGAEETGHMLERGQSVFTETFGKPARGFLAPAWQRGHVRRRTARSAGLEYVLGFLSLESCGGGSVPLATWTWDCGRWSWLGHVGDGVGRLLQTAGGRVPVLAIHPGDLKRGFWPQIQRRIGELLETGYEPETLTGLLEVRGAEVDF